MYAAFLFSGHVRDCYYDFGTTPFSNFQVVDHVRLRDKTYKILGRAFQYPAGLFEKSDVGCKNTNGGLAAAIHTELSVEPLNMCVHSMGRHAEGLSGRSFRVIIQDTTKNLDFSLRETEAGGNSQPF